MILNFLYLIKRLEKMEINIKKKIMSIFLKRKKLIEKVNLFGDKLISYKIK